MTLPRHSEPWWMITRVSGVILIAVVLAAVSVGVLLAIRRGSAPVRAQTRIHRRLSWVALGLLALHIGAALLDRRHVPPSALVEPFLSPTRRIAAGTGALATWGVVGVTLTAAGRRWLRPSWRKIHYLAYPASAFAVWHSLLGSDIRLLAFWLGLWSGVLLVAAVAKARGLWSVTVVPARHADTATRAATPPEPAAQFATGALPSAVSHRVPAHTLRPASARSDVAGPRWDRVDTGPRTVVEANRALDDALARFSDRQSLPQPDDTEVERLLDELRSSRPFDTGQTWPAPTSGLSPSAVEVAAQLLRDRGLTVGTDVARRMADHLLSPASLRHERSAEFRYSRGDGQDVSVVVTSSDLRRAMELARSRLPRPASRPLADVGTV